MADITETQQILDTELNQWFHGRRNTKQAKLEILKLFSKEPVEFHEWTEQDIREQSRTIISRWDNV